MRKYTGVACLGASLLAVGTLISPAQSWMPLLNSGQAIDWSQSGVGGIPERPKLCATLQPGAPAAQINTALASCPPGETVYLAEGRYSLAGTIHVPSNVTLRGAGADRTVLDAVGRDLRYAVELGSGSVAYIPVRIIAGATAGSTSIQVASLAGINVGKYLVIAETNNPLYVTAQGSEGVCRWCDGDWSRTGSFSRGQIVAVTAVNGNTVRISPGLYGNYTQAPFAVAFTMSASHAGVEDLQVRANNSGSDANFGLTACAFCWLKGVEANFTDGDYAEVFWGYRDEIRDSYFSNAFIHQPGLHDADLHIGYKTSASLVENNIFERAHRSIEVDWGAAGNVVAYNFTTGEFDSQAREFVLGGIFFHGAHPQFNLLEGNVLTQIQQDATWGSSSHTTAFRNWIVGTNRYCTPGVGREEVRCSEAEARYGFQAARAIEMTYLSTHNNFVGNLVGSSKMQSLIGYGHPLAQKAAIEYPAMRSYDAVAYGWSFGYGRMSDDGSGDGCSGGKPPCHAARTSATNFLHGNYDNIDGSIHWVVGVTHQLPASFYLSGKPAWWGPLPFPAIGPDVKRTGGPAEHSDGNPAQRCYLQTMGGAVAVTGVPLRFNAASCYRVPASVQNEGRIK
ncbi:MAG TPA: hypothetical protein VMV98_09075 [Acidobacteriaceae bacterium]|nr:hypothetical protein [Acidobacteriaceae bacterium]